MKHECEDFGCCHPIPSCPACNEEFDCRVCGYTKMTDTELAWIIKNDAILVSDINKDYWVIFDSGKNTEKAKSIKEAIEIAMKNNEQIQD